MKRSLAVLFGILLLTSCGGLGAGAPSSTATSTGRMKLGEVLIFHAPDLRPGADSAAFERYVLDQAASRWQAAAPGLTMSLVRSDRGSHRGYMLAWAGDMRARNRYAAPTGIFPFTAAVNDRAGDLRQGLAPFVNGGGRYFEYHLLSPEVVGDLPEVDILGMHFIKVRPDRRDAFERFVAEKLHPAVGNLRPDLRLLYYRSVRGPDAGNYLTIFALTRESRDKYWPGGADSDSVRAAFSPAVRALTGELSSYLVEGTWGAGNLAAAVYESREWADYNHVRTPRR